MPVLVVPNVFVNGTIADATLVDANFNAVSTIVNGLDWVNIGANGIFANQIIPTTVAQAAFGGNFGYTFNPNAAGQVPLTLQAVTGQSVDLFDVFLAGVKTTWLDNLGNFNMGAATSIRFPALTPPAAILPFGTAGVGSIYMATGAHYNYALPGWIADGTTACICGVANNGAFQIFFNTGLTVGATFSPVAVITTNSAGGVTFNGVIATGGGLFIGNGGVVGGSVSTLYSGQGVPPAGLGTSGAYYLRFDGGGAGATHIYFKNGAAWIGIA